MFDSTQQFFPTPSHTACKMQAKIKELLGHTPSEILDPSAGKGDLLNPYVDKYSSSWNTRCKTYAIEIDSDLRLILQDGHTVIGSDFLAFSEDVQFEAVIMNPPFNAGDAHALKAFTTVKPEGAIVGLLNAETLRNPYTVERRRLVNLIEDHGGWESLGSAFSKAERPTDVEVAMFWMKAPAKVVDPNSFKFSGRFQEFQVETPKDFHKNPLAHADVIDSLVSQYRVCCSLLKARSELQSELNFHLKSLPGANKQYSDKERVEMRFDYFQDVQDLKYKAWQSLFKMSRMSDGATSDFRKKFDEAVASMVKMEFSKDNILEILAGFFANREQIFIDSCCNVFDRATAYHEHNRIHKEGWKTNKACKLAYKIIIPNWGCKEGWSGEVEVSYDSFAQIFYNDLDQILSTLSEGAYTMDQKLYNWMKNHRAADKISFGVWHERPLYDVKFFKKGTTHIRFTDQYLIDDLNAIVGKERQWLGDGS